MPFETNFFCHSVHPSGNRDDSYKLKPTDQLGSSVNINMPEQNTEWDDPTKSIAWGGDFGTIPSRTPPPAYDPIDPLWYPMEDDYEFLLEHNKRSPDPEGVSLLLQKAEESLMRISKSVDRI